MQATPQHMRKPYQKGFALIDVMIAALILAVGIIAFVNLENVSIKRSQQINFRLQATQSATSLIEILRSDRYMVDWLINNSDGNDGNFSILAESAIPELNCKEGKTADSGIVSISNPSTWCSVGGDAISKDLKNVVQNNFSRNFQSVVGKAVMCLRSPDSTQVPTSIRVVVVWKNFADNSFSAANANADCPEEYDDVIPNIDNVNKTESDIGYFEIYTRI